MNQFLDQFAKQPLSVKLVGLLIVIIIIVALEYQLKYVPLDQSLKQAKKKRDELQLKYVENKAVADNLPRFREEVSALNEQLRQAVSLLPNDADIESILRQLSILAAKTNVDLLFFKPGGEKKQGFYSQLGMDLKLDGTYHDIAMFIDQVGKLSRIINISDIVFSAPRKRKAELVMTVDCKATTYMFAGGGAR